MFKWLQAAMGVDHGLAKVVKVGDRVQHSNTGQWGKVLEVLQQHDGTAELRVQREVRNEHDFEGEGWWATYHVGRHEAQATEEVAPAAG